MIHLLMSPINWFMDQPTSIQLLISFNLWFAGWIMEKKDIRV